VARPNGILITVFLALAGIARGEDTARDLRDQALGDLRGIHGAAAVQQHVSAAILTCKPSMSPLSHEEHLLSNFISRSSK